MLCFVVNDPLLEQKIVPLAIVVVSSFKNSLMPKKTSLIHTKIVLQFLQATHLSGENFWTDLPCINPLPHPTESMGDTPNMVITYMLEQEGEVNVWQAVHNFAPCLDLP